MGAVRCSICRIRRGKGTAVEMTWVRDLVVRRYRRLNEHDWAMVEEIAAEGYVDHEDPPGRGAGAAGTRRRLEALGGAFPDVRFEILDTIVDDRRAAVRTRITGSHAGSFLGIAPTGRSIDWETVDILSFNRAGEVTDHWGYGDHLALLEQLRG